MKFPPKNGIKLAALLLLSGASISAQNADAQTTEAPSTTAAPPSADPMRSAPATSLPSRPAYDPAAGPVNPATPAAQSTPVSGPAPVVADQATPAHPNVARNAYDYNGNRIPVHDRLGSTYIPLDSWIYPAILRLYSLGYADTAFIALRPWTRRSVLHMLDETESDVRFDNNEEAIDIVDKLYYALRDEPAADGVRRRGLVYGVDSAYAGARIIGGTVLRDSYHLGQTFNNDYGRPYSNGFNSYNGVSALTELGPFSLYVRGEYQHAPSYNGYDHALALRLASLDGINYGGNFYGNASIAPDPNRPTPTIPEGVLPSQNNFRVMEATLSAHLFSHEFSFGKSDGWMGPGMGSMAWTNNAENMYSFRINRVEPLYIPYISRIVGTMRYDFFVGALRGHTYPVGDWAHAESISFQPAKDFQIGFSRTIVWGGRNHQPVNLHTFLKGFFDINDTTLSEKYSPDDPGARFSSINFSWRLPFLRHWATLYTDSTTHDDVFPISAPRRAGWRPGIYLSHLPYAPKLDLRVEGTYTDYVTSRSTFGQGNYFETVQRQAYTNQGFLMGDWIGREAKGGQAWLTYHLSGNESVTFQYLRKKNAKDFIAGGTTQNIYRVDLVKRLTRDVELNAWFQAERWKAPIWKAGQQGSTTGAFQVTWFPRLRSEQ